MEKNIRARKKPNKKINSTVESNQANTNLVRHSFWKVIWSLVGLMVFVYLFPTNAISGNFLEMMENASNSVGMATKFHAVIIDAGSTGSRVLAFTFHKNLLTGHLILDDELWHEVKPGLSSFAGEPNKGGDTIEELLKVAKDRIPEGDWKNTPVTVKATAGLRLLPEDQSSALLQQVKEVLAGSQLKVTDGENGVEIMSELNEGVFGWFTINFLMKTINKIPESFVALDLGGGSTQITFIPQSEATIKESPPDFLHEIRIADSVMPVYSHSYLNIGLMAARRAVFMSPPGIDSVKLEPESGIKISNPCMVSTTPQSWTYQKARFTILRSSDAGYKACKDTVDAIIEKAKVHRPHQLSSRKIAAFSYLFDRALEAGLVTGYGGAVQVADFGSAAEKACRDGSKPFQCTDLTFISRLLVKGYGLKEDTTLHVYKKIDGHETSWALGAAFSILNN